MATRELVIDGRTYTAEIRILHKRCPTCGAAIALDMTGHKPDASDLAPVWCDRLCMPISRLNPLPGWMTHVERDREIAKRRTAVAEHRR